MSDESARSKKRVDQHFIQRLSVRLQFCDDVLESGPFRSGIRLDQLDVPLRPEASHGMLQNQLDGVFIKMKTTSVSRQIPRQVFAKLEQVCRMHLGSGGRLVIARSVGLNLFRRLHKATWAR